MIKKYYLSDVTKYEVFPFFIQIDTITDDFYEHTHDFFELMIVLGGNAVHVVNGQEFYLKAGNVFLISGDTSHSFTNVENLKICNIMFDLHSLIAHNEELKKLTGFQYLFILEPFHKKEYRYESKLILDPFKLKHVENLLLMMLDEYNKKKDGFRAVLKAYFLSLVAYLSRNFETEKNTASHKLHLLAEAIAYIENNNTDQIKVADAAKIAHLSIRHFIRLFKQNYGITPNDYIIQLKINYACKLLLNTDISITQISMECGFSDVSFFSRQFKAKLGVSPKEFKKVYS